MKSRLRTSSRASRGCTTAMLALVSLAVSPGRADVNDDLAQAVRGPTENAESARTFLQRGAQADFVVDREPLLNWAATSARVATMTALLDAGADVNRDRALAKAIESHKLDPVRLLLDWGADPTPGTPASEWIRATAPLLGLSAPAPNAPELPLALAVKSGDRALVDALLEAGASVDARDETGATALMTAAQLGATEIVSSLLDAGANPSLRDRTGATALDRARRSNQATAIALLAKLQDTAPNSPAITSVGPDQDLVRAVEAATDGQILVLGPGTYRGMIMIRDKALTIRGAGTDRTTLSGGQAVIVVGAGAHLRLEQVSVAAGGDTEFGVYVQGGSAVISNCTFGALKRAATLAEGGKLAAIGCHYDAIAEVGAVAVAGATVHIRDCSFAKGRTGIIGQDAKALSVSNSRFVDTTTAVQATGADCLVSVRHNTARVAADPNAHNVGIVVQHGARVVLADNVLVGFPAGISIEGAIKQPARLEENALIGTPIGIDVQLSTADGRTSAILDRNFICGASSCGVLLNETKNVRLSANTILTPAASAIVLQAKASAASQRNVVYSPKEAVGFRDTPATALTLAGERIAGPIGEFNNQPKGDDTTWRFNLAADQTGRSRAIRAAVEKVVALAPAPNASPADVVSELVMQWSATDAAAAKLARLSLHILDGAEQSFVPEFSAYELHGPCGHVDIFADDLTQPAALLAKLRAPADPVTKFVRAQLSDNLGKQIAAADGTDPAAELVESLAAELTRLLDQPSLYQPERFAAVKLWPSTQLALNDAKNAGAAAKLTTWRRANRYLLEDALPEEIAFSRAIARGTSQTPSFYLPAGSYWIVPTDFPLLLSAVDLADAETRDIEVKVPDALALTFKLDAKAPAERVLLKLLPRERMRQTIASIRREDLFPASIAMPRVGADPESVRAALALARRDYAKYRAGPTATELNGADDNRRAQLQGEYTRASGDAERIFAIAGDPSDLELIAKASPRPFGSLLGAAGLAAYIECRLGTVERGALVSALNGPDRAWALAAATRLHACGITRGDPLLLDLLRDPPARTVPNRVFAAPIAFALLDSADPALLPAMRGLVGRGETGVLAADIPATLYLLAYGDKSDWQRIGQRTLGTEYCPWLAFAASDPVPLADLLARQNATWDLALMTPALRSTPTQIEPMMGRLATAIYRRALEKEPGRLTQDQYKAAGPMHDFEVYTTFWHPHNSSAQLLAKTKSWEKIADLTVPFTVSWNDGHTPWLGWPMFASNSVAQYAQWTYVQQLDYFPRDEIVRRLQAQKETERVAGHDLLLAAYQIGSRAFYTNIDRYRDGIERRPYGFHYMGSQDDNGGLDGVAELVPSWTNGKLRLGLCLNQSIAYIPGSFIDMAPIAERSIYRYYEKNGRALVTNVRVRRGDSHLPVTEAKAAAYETVAYEVPLAPLDLSGMYLEVELSLYDQKWNFVYDLFASDLARRARLAGNKPIASFPP